MICVKPWKHNAVQFLEPACSEPNEESVRNRLNKQCDHLFAFLHHDGVDATNNLAGVAPATCN